MTNQVSDLSFHDYLQNGIRDFVSEFSHSEMAADVLAEFIVVLSSYQEEGVRLFPIVFIGEKLSDILSITEGIDPILLGQGNQSRESVRQAFKRFAPLTEGREWAAFAILENSSMSYGVFRTDRSPLVPTAFERLRQSQNAKLHALGLSRLGGSFVEIRSSSGQYRYVNLSADYRNANNPPKLIHDFMDVVTRDAPIHLRQHLRSFYYRVGVDLLHANHGTLLAVMSSKQKVPSIFQDGVLLESRIEITKSISTLLEENDEDSLQRLIGWNQLLRRMTRTDGVTLVDTSGAIVGYNCFVKSIHLEGKAGASVGGARRRAYEVLCSYLGSEISGVIYKSQDGTIEGEISVASE